MTKPGGTGVIGPFPPGVDTDEERDAYDRLRRRVLWKVPSGLYVVGSRSADGARRNGMTLNWLTQISFDPKWVGIGVERHAFTHELIDDAEVFTVCMLDREDRAVVRKFTKPVDVDAVACTLNGYPYHDGAVTGAPILDLSVAFLECEVRERLAAGDHTFFVGEVVNCGFLGDEDTPILSMADTRLSYGG
jgi:flavin reductase (DIM6/NTAB) family NADH-FMN oxidoreductase RutF